MKQIIVNDKTYIFVEVPDDAHSFRKELIMDGAGLYVSFEPRIEPYLALQSVKICKDNKDNYEIISTTKEITEEQAESIIEKIVGPSNKSVIDDYYKSYDIIKEHKPYRTFYKEHDYFRKAKESLQSLIQANGLDINKNYLILKKRKL